MKRVTRNGLIAAAAASGALAAVVPAHADSAADGAAAGSPGLISGNTVQLPVHVPVNLCGNTVNVAGLLNPAAGNRCANQGAGGGAAATGGGRHGGAGAHGGAAGRGGTAGGHGTDSRDGGGAVAHGHGKDSPGVPRTWAAGARVGHPTPAERSRTVAERIRLACSRATAFSSRWIFRSTSAATR
jgi:hypothetical protein